MHLELIKNTSPAQGDAYKIARVIYAETLASSLPVVEALASMIWNVAQRDSACPIDVAKNTDMFESLNSKSSRHAALKIHADDRGFQMCLRVTQRMLRGGLPDCCNGAVRFHRADSMPAWATARGYIADIDGLLFYL